MISRQILNPPTPESNTKIRTETDLLEAEGLAESVDPIGNWDGSVKGALLLVCRDTQTLS